MCGITGLVHLRRGRLEANCVLQAAHSMRHRGPDDEGYLLLNTAAANTACATGRIPPADIHHPQVTDPAPFSPDLMLRHTAASPSSTCLPAVTSR